MRSCRFPPRLLLKNDRVLVQKNGRCEGRVPATIVIPVDECLDSLEALLHVHVAFQINVLVLERSPEPLDIHVIQ